MRFNHNRIAVPELDTSNLFWTGRYGDVRLRYPANRDAPARVEHEMEHGKSRAEAVATLAEVWEEEALTRSPDFRAGSEESPQVERPKLCVWVVGRQQAGATQTAYWIEGFVRRLVDKYDSYSACEYCNLPALTTIMIATAHASSATSRHSQLSLQG